MNRRIPWRKRLLVRLLVASVLIAVCSVAATAWLAVATTTRALREEQGQVLAEDMDVLARLSGYAATHADWRGVERTVRELADRTGRRIALTTRDRTVVADSAAPGTPLPPRAAATLDPLRVDTFTERGAQRTGVDPRVVGPYRLSAGERAKLDVLAGQRRKCFARNGYDTVIVRAPSGRPVVTDHDGPVAGGTVPEECADGRLNTPTPTEDKALDDLSARITACLEKQGTAGPAPQAIGVDVTGLGLTPGTSRANRPPPASSGTGPPPSTAPTRPAGPNSTRMSLPWRSCSWAAATPPPSASTCHRRTRRRWSVSPGWCSRSPSWSPRWSPPGWSGRCAR